MKWISRAGGSPRAIFPPSTAISARTYHRHHNKCLIQLSEDETCELANQRKISKQHFPLCQQILVKCTYFSERNRQRIFCHCSHCLFLLFSRGQKLNSGAGSDSGDTKIQKFKTSNNGKFDLSIRYFSSDFVGVDTRE